MTARHPTLLVGIVVCSGCEIVLGEIPDQPALSAAGGNAGEHDASVAGAGGGGGRSAGSGGGLTGGATASGTGGVAGGASTTGVAGASTGGGVGGSMGSDGGREGGGGSGGSNASGGRGGNGGGSGSGGTGPRDAGQETPVVDPCDVDGDTIRNQSQQCGGTDCDDNNASVYPGEPVFYEMPTQPGGTSFDYDCNGLPQQRYSAVNCSALPLGLGCDTAMSGFFGTTAPACGQSGRFGHCFTQLLACVEQPEQDMMIMPCK